MKSFIHTFSIGKKISKEENDTLVRFYSKVNGLLTDKNITVIHYYSNKGIMMELTYCKKIEKKCDKYHRSNKLEIIINLHKLCENGMNFIALSSGKELYKAFEKLVDFLNVISGECGVDIVSGLQIKRIDVTCDVVTPSEVYSDEIIRAAKKAVLPYGFKFWKPSQEDIDNNGWKYEDSTMFNNHNQEFACKVYNKRKGYEMENIDVGFLGDNGIVRFEISLKNRYFKNKYLKNNHNIYELSEMELIGYIVNRVNSEADDILYRHMGSVFCTGDMLSLNLLKKYIDNKMSSKPKTKEKMLNYINIINKYDENDLAEVLKSQYKSSKALKNLRKKFSKLGISPVAINRECPYIPSFEKLIFLGGIDERLWLFANMHTKGKIMWETVVFDS